MASVVSRGSISSRGFPSCVLRSPLLGRNAPAGRLRSRRRAETCGLRRWSTRSREDHRLGDESKPESLDNGRRWAIHTRKTLPECRQWGRRVRGFPRSSNSRGSDSLLIRSFARTRNDLLKSTSTAPRRSAEMASPGVPTMGSSYLLTFVLLIASGNSVLSR